MQLGGGRECKHTFGGGSSEKVGLARPKPETPAYIILRKPEYARVLFAICLLAMGFLGIHLGVLLRSRGATLCYSIDVLGFAN